MNKKIASVQGHFIVIRGQVVYGTTYGMLLKVKMKLAV